MVEMKHNWPDDKDPAKYHPLSVTLVGSSFIYSFWEKGTMNILEYFAGSRTWREVKFGSNIWVDPYAPKPITPCGWC